MKTAQAQPFYQTIQRGVRSLLEEIGPRGAMEFFRFFYTGKGNSVKEFNKMWKGMDIDSIHKEIMEAKKQKQI